MTNKMINGQKQIWLILISVIVLANFLQAQIIPMNRTISKVQANVVKDYHVIKIDRKYFEKANNGTSDDQPAFSPKSSQFNPSGTSSGSSFDYVADFYISGNEKVDFSISLPHKSVALTNPEQNNELIVKNWQSNLLKTESSELSGEGYNKVNIRATFEVNDYLNNKEGHYSGFYIVTFDFN